MKETPRQFAARTGATYAPDRALAGLGRPLGPDDAAPTLFRYPGPHALLAAMDGVDAPLAPGPLVYLGERADVAEPGAVHRFGAIAVLDPLALGVVATDTPGVWRGWALRPHPVVWVPPHGLGADADAWASPADVIAAIPAYREALADLRDDLSRYVEELSALARAGGPGPEVPWHELPDDLRRARLDAAGVPPRWTR